MTSNTNARSVDGIGKKTLNDPSLTPYEHLLLVVEPLLEFFATSDDVWSEDGAFLPENMYKALGNLYRGWKLARKKIDSEFNSKKWRQTSAPRTHMSQKELF